jgi:signal transduction histidine kinase
MARKDDRPAGGEMGAFFSGVSHELRTPLTLLLGPVEQLLAGVHGELTAAQREQSAMIQRNALRLLKVVNTVLDLAQIESGRIRARFVPVDLAALTVELAGVFRVAIERAGLALEVSCPPLPEPVHVDREMWEKIVLNLLSNAFKFTFEGRIGVVLRADGEHVVLEVTDTGVGIAADDVERVFDRFHRVHQTRARSHEGSGTGLALVQELARLHGGGVELESERGRGSTFRVTIRAGVAHLPEGAVALTPIDGVSPESRAYVSEASAWLSGPDDDTIPPVVEGGEPRSRILIADDNSDMRAYLRRLLTPHHEVQIVADGVAALEAARADPPDLILSDVMMPGLDGFGLLRELRADPRTRDVPFMLLSARSGEEARLEGLDAGADDYLIKPFGAREVVARVRSQLAIAAGRRALAAHRAGVYEVFVQAPVPICVLRGPELTFEMANPLYHQVVGARPLLGRALLEALPELADQGVAEKLLEVMRTGEPQGAHEVVIRLGGDESHWSFVYAPLRNGGSHVDRVMAVCTEITEQVRYRNELSAAREEAEAANRAKDEFLAMLGHELRNPLSPILTALQLIGLRDAGDGFVRERQVIERQVHHLVRLVDDLLDVSRVARGKLQLKRRPIEIATVVAKAVELASPVIEDRRHRLSLAVPAAGLVVRGDEVRLTQVISNLLTNAARYTEPGGSIAVTATRNGGTVRLSVRDDGMGISSDLLPKIFDLFVQGGRSGLRAGLGLGLAIVRSLVDLHGGAVSARSDGPGKGSEFLVELPLVATTQETSATTALDLANVVAVSGRRILVVDDNEDAADVLADVLRLAGHEVRVAHDGLRALEAARSFDADLVLLDIGLPVMDGYEVARRMRDGSFRARLIAVTGYGQDVHREQSKQAGFDEHLVKPIDLAAIRRLIEELPSPVANR